MSLSLSAGVWRYGYDPRTPNPLAAIPLPDSPAFQAVSAVYHSQGSFAGIPTRLENTKGKSMTDPLMQHIDAFIQAKGITPSNFGGRSVQDTGLYADMLRGRRLGDETRNKIIRFMADNADVELKRSAPSRSVHGKVTIIDVGPPIARANVEGESSIRHGTDSLLRAIVREHPRIVQRLTERQTQAA